MSTMNGSLALIFLTLDVMFTYCKCSCEYAEWRVIRGEHGSREKLPTLTNSGHCITKKGVVWMFGGHSDHIDNRHSNLSDRLWSYEVLTNRWKMNGETSNGKQLPSGRHSSILCCAEDHLVLYGGITSNSTPVDDIWLFDMSQVTWTQIYPQTTTNMSTLFEFELTNSRSIISWCLEDSLWHTWYVESDRKDPSYSLPQIWHFSPTAMQWKALSINTSLGGGTGSVSAHPELIGMGAVVQGYSVWLFPNIMESIHNKSTHLRVWSLSMWSLTWAVHLFEIEAHCSQASQTILSNNYDLRNQNTKNKYQKMHHSSNNVDQNITIITGKKNLKLWYVNLNNNKVWTSNSCNAVPDAITKYPCNIQNSLKWFYNDALYLYNGGVLCNNETLVDDLWAAKLTTKQVCNSQNIITTLTPSAIFMIVLFSLFTMAIIVMCIIILNKWSHGPYLKPPVHYGRSIKYSQLAFDVDDPT